MNELGAFGVFWLLVLLSIWNEKRAGMAGIEQASGVMMLALSVVAAKMVPVFGFPSNAGNPVYAAVTVVVAVAVLKHGPDAARGLVWRTMLMLILGHAVFGFANIADVAPGNEAPSAALKSVTGPGLRLVAASFLAFALAQMVTIVVLMEGRDSWWYAIAVFLAQIVDSAVFFPAAFYKSGVEVPNAGIILSGVGIKTALCLMALPVIWGNTPREEHHP